MKKTNNFQRSLGEKKLKLIEKNQKTQNNQSFTEQNYQRCPQYTKVKMFGIIAEEFVER